MAYKPSVNIRKTGEDKWSSPNRDIIELWPSAIVRGAAFACQAGSSLNGEMTKRGLSAEDIRRNMILLLNVVNDSKFGSLAEALADVSTQLDVGAYHIIMAGAGGMLFKDFNYFYRESNFTTKAGGHREPTERVDTEKACSIFDKLYANFE